MQPPNQMGPSNGNHVNGQVQPVPPPAQPNHQMHMGTIPISMTGQPIAGYYSEMPVTSPNSDAFELVSDGGGMLSGGRMSKKDVKRRTKTGCLTCRKRRIKVSESFPRAVCSGFLFELLLLFVERCVVVCRVAVEINSPQRELA